MLRFSGLRLGVTLSAILGLVAPAAAHQGFGGLGSLGDLRLIGRHAGLFDGGLLGSGLFGGLGAEFRQDRFEDKFEELTAAYDEGLAEVTDFYNSAEYTQIVSDAERLVDRYDRFVTGVERSVERIDNVITFANHKITDLDELLADLQERDNISEARLARIENLIAGAQDFLTLKVNLLTDHQTDLQEGLTTYQAFETSLSDYLEEIVSAGGDADAAALTAITAASVNVSAPAVQAIVVAATGVASEGNTVSVEQANSAAAAVPEPQTAALAGLASAAFWWSRRRAG